MTQSHSTSQGSRHEENRPSSDPSTINHNRSLDVTQYAPDGTYFTHSGPSQSERHPPTPIGITSILPSTPPLPVAGTTSTAHLSNSAHIPSSPSSPGALVPCSASQVSPSAGASLAQPKLSSPPPSIESITAGALERNHSPPEGHSFPPLPPSPHLPNITNPRSEAPSSPGRRQSHHVTVSSASSAQEAPIPPVPHAPAASHPHQPSPNMSAAAPSGQPMSRTAIANLVSPPRPISYSADDRNLHSLSQLAAAMPHESTAAPTADRRQRPSTYRAATPAQPEREGTLAVSTLPDDQRRAAPIVTPPSSASLARMQRTSSLQASALRVSRSSSKKPSRSRSGLSPSRARRAAIEAVAVSRAPVSAPNTAPASPVPGATDRRSNLVGPLSSVGLQDSSAVLRSISQNPIAADTVHGFSQTAASNSSRGGHGSAQVHTGGSSVYRRLPKAALEAAARNISPQFSRSLRPSDAMDVEPDHDFPEISSSSHDNRSGGLEQQLSPTVDQAEQVQAGSARGAGARSKTTPDVKRAQNRESAKRFRVAQKQRWREKEEEVQEKIREIAKLKKMLQDITSTSLERNAMSGSGSTLSVQSVKLDLIVTAELNMYRDLLAPRTDPAAGSSSTNIPMASDIGSLYRVLVSQLDGNVFGIRYENKANGAALGPEVGGCLWDGVHPSDNAHLRCNVVHMDVMVKVSEQPMVFSYRRRRAPATPDPHESDEITPAVSTKDFIRLKGCLYPLIQGENKEVIAVVLAEFVELTP